jgi:metal-responsive CopG/Arc/MetJ family transcriptional regulator
MDLNKEAEEYAIKHHLNKHKGSGDSEIISFIAGADSKYVQAKIIQAQIEENESILRMLKLHGNGRNRLPVIARISELQVQLKELENE